MMKRIEICAVVSDKKIFKVFYIDISGNPMTSLFNKLSWLRFLIIAFLSI